MNNTEYSTGPTLRSYYLHVGLSRLALLLSVMLLIVMAFWADRVVAKAIRTAIDPLEERIAKLEQVMGASTNKQLPVR